MRGKVREFWINLWDKGITPAYAGKRRIFDGWRSRKMDHPRLCGEKRTAEKLVEHPPGSPPPMRGKAPFQLAFEKE